ncbi:hypothetical protein Hanom_Chr12g01149391 [Helianthus anomalus]
MATSVTKPTYADLHINLNMLTLNLPTKYSFLMNLFSGHFSLLQHSTNAKNGWINTYIDQVDIYIAGCSRYNNNTLYRY